MILHLGGDAVIPLKDIIAILDIESAEYGAINKEFVQIARDEGNIIRISDDPPKSLIMAGNKDKTILYLSPISTVTLMKRSNNPIDVTAIMHINKGENR